ncbi:helix-turn-helix transcriptional regulator [Phenylobacterium sp.]|jgi:ribosome-binding protein aMBF1 (putative translation factor)|uniref:helix-turn-helix domain-containing protein n=1 Tax=Phenylobacterium sp. TaxID=1871053 RepID=UPI002F3E5CB8
MEAQHTLTAAALDIDAANDSRSPGLRPAPITPATNRYIQERLGRAIRLRRRMMDMTLEDLARYCGVTFQQVHKYESGLCAMSASQLWSISVALGVPVAYFYESLAAPEQWRPLAEDPHIRRR